MQKAGFEPSVTIFMIVIILFLLSQNLSELVAYGQPEVQDFAVRKTNPTKAITSSVEGVVPVSNESHECVENTCSHFRKLDR
jgi:hypothetical protein